MPKEAMLSLRLSKELYERLDRLAELTGRTKTYYVQKLLEEYLDELEDYYLSAAVLERVRQGKEEVLSLEEAEKELGLED